MPHVRTQHPNPSLTSLGRHNIVRLVTDEPTRTWGHFGHRSPGGDDGAADAHCELMQLCDEVSPTIGAGTPQNRRCRSTA